MSSVSSSELNASCVATLCIENTIIANCLRNAPTEIWWIRFAKNRGTTFSTSTCLSYTKKRWNNIFTSLLTSTPSEMKSSWTGYFPQRCKQETGSNNKRFFVTLTWQNIPIATGELSLHTASAEMTPNLSLAICISVPYLNSSAHPT